MSYHHLFLVAAVQVLPQFAAAASWTHASDRVVDLIRPKQTPSFYSVPIGEEINHRLEQLAPFASLRREAGMRSVCIAAIAAPGSWSCT